MFLTTEKERLYFEIGTWFLLDNNLASQGHTQEDPYASNIKKLHISALCIAKCLPLHKTKTP